MTTLIKSFHELSAADVGSAGGKGANLGEMFRKGIPVPDGFTLLTQCYDEFLRTTGLDARIATLVGALDGSNIEALEAASGQVTGWILDEPLSQEISDLVYTFFDRLSAPLVAVRSSANAEDSADSAWAGQLETFLGTTRATLLENIKKCWASLFMPRAFSYRFQHNLMGADISVAVVVQEMIASEVAGVAFSVHPVTQDPDQMIIEAGYGLGEAVVSGSITPDSYIIRKSDRTVMETYLSEQKKGIFLNPQGGSSWQDIPASQSTTTKLDTEEILSLSALVIHIEQTFGFPCDIEWARRQGHWYILQCRPITTLDSEASSK